MTELERNRKYEKLGYHHLAAADRALRQITLPNAPKLKFFDAVDLWNKSGKCFAIAGEWEESAHSFSKAAEFMVKLNKPHEAAVFWLKSAEMLRRVDPVGSMVPYNTAAKLYLGLDRFATAANITRNLAEMLEEFREWDNAVTTYEKAAEYYDSEHYNAQCCVCLYKAGYILALLEKFDRAVALFERVFYNSTSPLPIFEQICSVLFCSVIFFFFFLFINSESNLYIETIPPTYLSRGCKYLA
mmetsp:Transcript_38152/g.49371  ORF Transcript_38152/g.49371 Transcript_38152/m.49371 type:complete len:243 (+) Transcript_38152:50-778(+)